jgi:hypothetical protein
MTLKRSVLWGVLLGLIVTVVYACGTPTPVPDPPGPTPEPVTSFSGFWDCSAQDNSAGVPWANTCGDVTNTAQCFEDLATQGASRALLICASRDVQVEGFIEIARGTAGPELSARVARLRAWLASTNATLRSDEP